MTIMKPGFAEGDVSSRSVAIVPMEFLVTYEQDPGTDVLKPVEWATWARIGSNGSTTSEKVERVKKHNPVVWSVLKPAYEAWKAGEEAPVEGTPLEAWPGLTRSQVAAFKLINLRSVEDVAAANDATMDRMGMGARALVRRAQSFLEARTSGVAAIAAAKAEADAKIKMLEERLAELEERLVRTARARKGDDAA